MRARCSHLEARSSWTPIAGLWFPEFSPRCAASTTASKKRCSDEKRRGDRVQTSLRSGTDKRMEVAANASSGEELILAFEEGADGIGLFRTEMLFLGRDDAPSEAEQFAIYSEAARIAAGRPVIIRTFDIRRRQASALSESATRSQSISRTTVAHASMPSTATCCRTQLRAILRASTARSRSDHGAHDFVTRRNRATSRLPSPRPGNIYSNGVAFDPNVAIGVMVEVPSIAFISISYVPR